LKTVETIYLNNAATGWPKGPGVVEAVTSALQRPPIHPGRAVEGVEDVVTECRQRLATLLDVKDPSRIVLTVGATQSLNLAILGLRLPPAGNVVVTASEHNSVLRPLNRLRQQCGIRIQVVGFDSRGCVDLEQYDRALATEPMLVALNHASNVTGRVNDARMLLGRAKTAGAVTLLDASQTLAHRPVRPAELNADLVAFTGHKGLHGPPGSGGLYISPALELEQIIVGGTGVRSDLVLHPPEMPMRLEAGTPNVPAFAGMAAALRWVAERGESFGRHEQQLVTRLYEELGQTRGIRLFDAESQAERVGVISFRLDKWDVDETAYVLSQSFGVLCRSGLHCAPLIHEFIGSAPAGTVRFSPSGFTTNEQMDVALDALRRLST
jgi:selenocysteine lyase/cysteine desulfurase